MLKLNVRRFNRSRHQGNTISWGNILREVGRVQYGFEEAANPFGTTGQLGQVLYLLKDRKGVGGKCVTFNLSPQVEIDTTCVSVFAGHLLYKFFHTLTGQTHTCW